MHTVEFFEEVDTLDSAVWCTPRSLTLRSDAHRRAWLSGWWDAHHGVRLIRKCLFFVFSYLLRLSTLFYRNMSQVKKIPWIIFDLQYQFHINIVRHHGEIAFVKLWIRTDTWLFIDSAVWRTPRSWTPLYDAHHRVWLHGGMHTAESDFTVGCTLWSFLKNQISWRNRNWIRKYFSLFIRGPDGFE